MTYGTGQHRYELQPGWAKLPEGWHFVDVSGLAIDESDRVYVFSRSDHPVTIFDRGGALVGAWGEGRFVRPHSILAAADGNVWCTDDGNQTISKFSATGALLLQFGGSAASGDAPGIGRITGIAVAPNGDVLVGDTHAAQILRFAPDGRFIASLGERGSAPGQFADPHFFWFDPNGNFWVVDRDNNRLQIFDPAMRPIGHWPGLDRPTALFIARDGTVYVSEGHQRISIFGPEGRLLSRFGSQGEDKARALFHTPHAIVVDRFGDIYVGENRHGLGSTDAPPRAVQKFAVADRVDQQDTFSGRTTNVVSA